MTNESTVDTFVPKSWNEYVGQDKVKDQLKTYIDASVATNTPFQHTLLFGPPGCGKTTLAEIIANELGDAFKDLTMPVDQKVLEDTVTMFQGVLFLDEIHRATKKQQEDLLNLLQFGFMQSKAGYKIEAGWLTIIAATTKPTLLDDAVLDRFQFKPDFIPYTDEEMARIIGDMAMRVSDVDLVITDADCHVLAKAAGGKPRAARDIVLAARALAVRDSTPSVEDILYQVGVDADGLGPQHMRYLETLKRFGGVAGLAKIAGVLGMGGGYVQDLEKVLFRNGFIDHSDKGRRLTATGYRKVNTGTADYTRDRTR